MSIITFTSDFGLRDTTVARLKARFLQRAPGVTLVDVSHQVEPHNITEAAYMVRTMYRDFPAGTVHCVFVGSRPSADTQYICLKADGQYFIGCNNGLLTAALRDGKVTGARSLDIRGADPNDEKDVFAAAAGHLIQGGKMDMLGPLLKSVKSIKEHMPAVSEFAIRGHVIYIDRFGTCVTNISKELFTNHLAGRRASVEVARSRSITKIYDRIAEVPSGNIAALWNEQHVLCVAVGKSGGDHIRGSNELLGMKINDWVRIDFL